MTNDIQTIWNDFHKELKGFILKKTGDLDDTNDLIQEVFLKIIHNMDKVEKANNLRQYLYAIVRNAVNDYFRAKKKFTDDAQTDEKLSEEEITSLNTTIAACCIQPFIQKLPETYREALLLTEFEDISQKELAEKLKISYSGAKSRVQRGKEKLKELILNCCALQSDKYGNIQSPENNNCNCS